MSIVWGNSGNRFLNAIQKIGNYAYRNQIDAGKKQKDIAECTAAHVGFSYGQSSSA
jgi:hypothetical protein